MDRRASLALLLGKKDKTTTLKTTTSLGTLNPYMGTWGVEQAAHLLRRTTFGPTKIQINQAVTDGLDSTVNLLLMPQPMRLGLVYPMRVHCIVAHVIVLCIHGL